MTAFWNGIAAFFEFIFKLIKPVGMYIDIIFMIIIAFGCAYWLIYEQKVMNGGKNYLADKVKEKE
ncbi:MAG TPA: hypothetical protein PKN75_07075 [Bacteroidia bacterium]|nr:hypothetical protein [Bacteroidia bacterium]HNU33338.1 hypothetical protein [Bacteroidia bacterium]